MKERIHAYILTRLSRAASEDDLIFSVCEKTGWGWDEAQTFVQQVKSDHLAEIEAKQIPLKSLIAFVFYTLGILLTFGPIIYLWIMLDVTSTFLVFISGGFGADAETALYLLGRRCMLLGWFELPTIFFTMAMGLGIIHANLQYMRGIWEGLFQKWRVFE